MPGSSGLTAGPTTTGASNRFAPPTLIGGNGIPQSFSKTNRLLDTTPVLPSKLNLVYDRLQALEQIQIARKVNARYSI